MDSAAAPEMDATIPAPAPQQARGDDAIRTAFGAFDTRFRAPLRRWAKTALATQCDTETVFYPFGGPDLCVAHDLFPRATTYVLVGREPATAAGVAEKGAVLTALRHYLEFSYFITNDLAGDLQRNGSGGVAALLMMQVVESGWVPMGVREIADGVVEIGFRAEGTAKRVIYVRQDLRDGYWPQDDPLAELLAGGFATILKSASYLLHEPHFSELRETILSDATVVVQDPSGVPYRDLLDWNWRVDLHGQFTTDIPFFSRRYDQSLLAAAYAALPRRQTLGFGIGYLFAPERAALMVARPSRGGGAIR